jgi:hypothetical protein
VLTITISIASGADAIFSFLPPAWLPFKLAFTFLGLGVLTLMNLRGVKESVTIIAPVFFLFVATHALLLLVVLGGHLSQLPAVMSEVRGGTDRAVSSLGALGALALFVRAYSLGGGTYTGIEAVSNGVAMMREPRVATARRTMVLMATSLAITASGILLAYLLIHARPVEGKTLNAVLFETVASGWHIAGFPVGTGFAVVSLVSEGALLFVAAQAGFVDGPRVMANMATDSWLPHRYSALSERLTMRNGVMLMAGAAAAALLYTRGDVSKLVVMYSINVFVTFSLSNIGMSRFWIQKRANDPSWLRHLPAHLVASALCLVILGITVVEKFTEGGWLTLLITIGVTSASFLIRRHYGLVVRAIRRLDRELPGPEESPEAAQMYGIPSDGDPPPPSGTPDSSQPVAILFVGGYGGLGRHALMTLERMFPGHFKSVVFASVAVVDSDSFKGASELEALERRTSDSLARYERFAAVLGYRTTSAYSVGTEVAVAAEQLATDLRAKYPKALVVAGQIIFDVDTAWNRLLHNETAFLIQRRLQHHGVPMVVLPVQLDLRATRKNLPPQSRRSLEGLSSAA